MAGEGTVGDKFDRGPNALNFVRLVLALQVLVWHAYALRGDTWLPGTVETLLSAIAVDGFFAISGFLIALAWCRRKSSRAFLTARARRIVPGLALCLALTGLLIVRVGNGSWSVPSWSPTWVPSSWTSVRFAGPTGVPYPGEWNGSLWSLGYEVACYLLVAALGCVGLWRRSVVIWLAGVSWTILVALTVADLPFSGWVVWSAPRCLLMFSLGAIAWFLRDHIAVSRHVFGLSLVAIGCSAALPAYQVLAAPAVTYTCIAGGIWLGKFPTLVRRNDISYGVYVYGFPVQQLLLTAGSGALGWAGFAGLSAAAVTPVAWLSWRLVERPFLQSRSRIDLGASQEVKTHPGDAHNQRRFPTRST